MNDKRAAPKLSHLRLVESTTTMVDQDLDPSEWSLVLDRMPREYFEVLEAMHPRYPYLSASLSALLRLKHAHTRRDESFSSFGLFREVFHAASDPSNAGRLSRLFAMPMESAAARAAGTLAVAQELIANSIHEAWAGDAGYGLEQAIGAVFLVGVVDGRQGGAAAQDTLERMYEGASRGGIKGTETRRAKAKVPSPAELREQRDQLIAAGTAPRDVAGKLAARHGCSPGHIRKTLEKRD